MINFLADFPDSWLIFLKKPTRQGAAYQPPILPHRTAPGISRRDVDTPMNVGKYSHQIQ